MFYLLAAMGFFFIAVFIHIQICRAKRSQAGLWVKLFCVIAGFGLGLCWLAFVAFHHVPHRSGLWALPLELTSSLIYLLLVPSYVVFYVSTQMMSPSKRILMLIDQAGGMELQQLKEAFSDEEFIMPRLRDLEQTGCIAKENGTYKLTPSGLALARFLNCYQILLGRKAGG
jgi:hypothetical protein